MQRGLTTLDEVMRRDDDAPLRLGEASVSAGEVHCDENAAVAEVSDA
jgi:hypothetical protein